MDHLVFAIIPLAIFLFALISGRLQSSIITPPMAFVAVGLLIGPIGLGMFHIEIEGELVKILAEITLVLILFTDASRIHLRTLREGYQIPLRMLGIGLPLTIASGAFVAHLLIPEFSFWEVALLAALLAPTDAALGQAVVSNPRVPVRMRQALNVESGLNDGLALPIILFLISMASIEQDMSSTGFWVGFVLQQILLGAGIGIAIGYVGGKLIAYTSKIGWMNYVFQEISSIALAIGCFAVAELFGGNGFIAAFVGGLTLGNTSREICTCLYEFIEAEGQLLALLTFLVFGTGMVVFALNHPEIHWFIIILFSLLSLTLIRMIPVAISLIGLKLRFDSQLYLGWFGPRGIATILFGLIVVEETGIVHGDAIFAIAMITVLTSVFAHGLTASPLAKVYADRLAPMEGEDDMPEQMPVVEIQPKFPFTGK